MSTSFESSDDNIYEYTCGKVKLKIKNEMLTVNDKSYGELKSGEPVEVDHGKVFIAGEERAPMPAAADDETKQADPEKD